MATASVWLLIFAASVNRPAVVIAQFDNQMECERTVRNVKEIEDKRGAWLSSQYPFCLEIRK